MHAVDAGEYRAPRPKQRYEAAEEDDAPAVAPEEIDPDLEGRIVDAEPSRDPAHEAPAAFAADREAEVVAEDGREPRDADDARDREAMRGAGVGARGDQHRLAGRRDTRALEKDEQCDGTVAVRREQRVEMRPDQRKSSPSDCGRPPFSAAHASFQIRER